MVLFEIAAEVGGVGVAGFEGGGFDGTGFFEHRAGEALFLKPFFGGAVHLPAEEAVKVPGGMAGEFGCARDAVIGLARNAQPFVFPDDPSLSLGPDSNFLSPNLGAPCQSYDDVVAVP